MNDTSMIHRATASACFVVLAACSGASTEPTERPEASADVAPPSPPVAEAEPAAPTEASSQPVPDAFKLDGSLAEWAPGPSDNYVIVAPSPTKLVLAGAVPSSPSQGIWIALQGPSGELPPVGMWQRGGGVMTVDCDAEVASFNGMPFTEEGRVACQAEAAANKDFADGVYSQFERTYRVTDKGVAVLDGTSESKPLATAKVRTVATGGGMTFEAEIDLRDMPRVAQAPLESIGVIVSSTRPRRDEEKEPAPFAYIGIDPPVGFEPDALMRAHVFLPGFSFGPPPLRSYQPGQGNAIQVVGYPAPMATQTLTVTDHAMYTPLSTLGGYEIGKTWSGQALLRHPDGLIEPLELEGDVQDVVKRGTSLHVIGLYDSTETDSWTQTTRFSVCAVHADGKVEPIGIEPAPFDEPFDSGSTSTSSGKDFTTFSVEGKTKSWDGSPSKKVKFTWRWNAKENAYLLSKK